MNNDEVNNCASRVRGILLNAAHEGDTIDTITAWANVLDPTHEKGFDHYRIIGLLDSLRNEIRKVSIELESRNVPSDVYEKHIENALKATQASNLGAQWKNFKNHISPELITALSFSSHIIGLDEYQFVDEDIEEISSIIITLKETISSENLSPIAKHFLDSQIIIFENSISEYRVRGSDAFKGGFIEGITAIVENEDVIRENSESDSMGILKNLLEKFRNATSKAAEANKTIETWSKIVNKVNDAIGLLSN